MTSPITEITIEHLPKADAIDIEERIGDQTPTRAEAEAPAGSQGEPVLIALTVIATAAALKAYVAHLRYKARVLPDERIEHRVTVKRGDGSVEEHVLIYEAREGEAFSDAAVRELSNVPGLADVLREHGS